MSFYHWFSSHPNEISLSGDSSRMSTIGKELRIAGANKENATKQSDFRRISSVPDIWSQHRLFEMLLLNKVEDVSIALNGRLKKMNMIRPFWIRLDFAVVLKQRKRRMGIF